MVNLFIEKSLWMSSFNVFKRLLFMIWNLKNSFSYQVKILLLSVDFNVWLNLDSKAICHVMQTFPNQVLTNESSPESRPDFGLEIRVKTWLKTSRKSRLVSRLLLNNSFKSWLWSWFHRDFESSLEPKLKTKVKTRVVHGFQDFFSEYC